MDLKIVIFWDITSCSAVKINIRFGATYPYNLHSRTVLRYIQEIVVSITTAVITSDSN
jgi:hypothetical protein